MMGVELYICRHSYTHASVRLYAYRRSIVTTNGKYNQENIPIAGQRSRKIYYTRMRLFIQEYVFRK